MNTLYLSYDGLTDPLGQSQVIPYVIGLRRKGWDMHVVSFEKENRYAELKQSVENLLTENQINWRPLIYTKSPPVFSTLIDLKSMDKVVKQMVKEHSINLIHCRSYLPMLVALSFQKKRIKIVFDMRGFWVDERVEGKIWNLKNPLFKMIYRYFKRKEKLFLMQADGVVSLTEAALPILQNQTKMNPVVIPTATDLELFSPENVNVDSTQSFRKELGFENHNILGYLGSVSTWYLLDEMLQLFKKLDQPGHPHLFLILTHDDPKIVFKNAEALGIKTDKIRIIKAERNMVPKYLSLMDYAVMFIKPSYSKTASSPTKLGEFMAMGVPVICNTGVGDVQSIVEKYRAGLVLKHLDETAFVEASNLILSDLSWFSRPEMMKGALEYFDLNKGIDQYDQLYRKLIKTT